METALAQQSWRSATNAAHGIKDMAGHICANKLQIGAAQPVQHAQQEDIAGDQTLSPRPTGAPAELANAL